MSDPLESLPWQSGTFPATGVYVCRLAKHLRGALTVLPSCHGAWIVTVLPDGRSREDGWNPRMIYPAKHNYTQDAAEVEWVRVDEGEKT